MRKADKIKLSVIVGVSLLAFVVGCVDTAVQPIPTSVDYKSEVSIVNLTTGTGTATVSLFNGVADQDSLARNVLFTRINYSSPALNGTADVGSVVPASSYKELPSGNKAIVVSYSTTGVAPDTFRVSLDSQTKMRLFIFGDTTAGGRSYVKSTERYTWQTPGSTDGAALFPANTGQLKVVNGIPDSTVSTVEIKGGTVDTTISLDLDFAGFTSGYSIQVPSGTTYKVYVTTSGGAVDSVDWSPGKGRYTNVVYNSSGTVKTKILTDD